MRIYGYNGYFLMSVKVNQTLQLWFPISISVSTQLHASHFQLLSLAEIESLISQDIRH